LRRSRPSFFSSDRSAVFFFAVDLSLSLFLNAPRLPLLLVVSTLLTAGRSLLHVAGGIATTVAAGRRGRRERELRLVAFAAAAGNAVAVCGCHCGSVSARR